MYIVEGGLITWAVIGVGEILDIEDLGPIEIGTLDIEVMYDKREVRFARNSFPFIYV
ncbi:hypothetical protein HON59_01595 [bacterium]|nr:hypothetical protein [bacterium]MBT4894737.1 hypothetical protein [bacterium]